MNRKGSVASGRYRAYLASPDGRRVVSSVTLLAMVLLVAGLAAWAVPRSFHWLGLERSIVAFLLMLPVATLLHVILTNVDGLWRRTLPGAVVVGVAASLLALAVTPWGFVQFGSYDLSLVVDLTWRFDQGQVPVRDFVSTLPLSFVVLARIATLFGEANWLRLEVVGVAFTSLMIIGVSVGLRLTGVRSTKVMVVGVVGMAIPWIATTHIWHSSITAQAAAAAIALAAACSRRRSWWLAVLLGLLLGFLLGGKQNVAWPMAAGVVLVTAAALRKSRGQVAVVLLVGVLTYVLLAWSVGLSPLHPIENFFTFVAERDRGLQLIPQGTGDMSGVVLLLIPWVVLPAMMIAVGAWIAFPDGWNGPRPRAIVILASVILALGWFAGVGSNWDSHWNDVPLASTAVALLLTEWRPGPRARQLVSTGAIVSLTVVMLAVALGEGSSRLRMRYVGPLYQEGPLAQVEKGYLRGMQMGSWGLSVVAASDARKQWCPQPSTVIFGPRLEFLYAQWKVPSPVGLPMWWHPGSSYSVASDLPSVLVALEGLRPIQLVTLGDDFTRLPAELSDELSRTPVTVEIGPLRVRCLP